MNTETIEDELREEYNLDYSKAKANRFASRAGSEVDGSNSSPQGEAAIDDKGCARHVATGIAGQEERHGA